MDTARMKLKACCGHVCLYDWLSICVCVPVGVRGNSDSVNKLVIFKSSAGQQAREEDEHDDEDEVLNEQTYVEALGMHNTEGVCLIP